VTRGVLTHQAGTDDRTVGVDDPPAHRAMLIDVVRFVVGDLETADGTAGSGTQDCCAHSVVDARPAPQTGFTHSAVQ